jgi:CHAT domain-containing protein/uncharacterized protein HemY
MDLPLAKSPWMLFGLGVWISVCPASTAENDDLKALYQKANQLYEQGKDRDAIPVEQKIIEILRRIRGPEHPETAEALYSLGFIFYKLGEYTEAEPLYLQALRIRQKMLGPESPDTASSLNSLATLYDATSQYTKAEPLFVEALRIRKKVLGPEHSLTANSLNNLALVYDHLHEYTKAVSLYQEALRISQKVSGPENPHAAAFLDNLGSLYRVMAEYDKAEPVLQEAYRIRKNVLGSDHPETAISIDHLGGLYQEMGEYAKAESLLKDALRIRQSVFGPTALATALSLNNLGELYTDMGEYAKAEPPLSEALRIRQNGLGPDHIATATSLNNLALLYYHLGDYAKAEPLYEKARQVMMKVNGPLHPDTAIAISNLAELYREMREYARAESLDKQALLIRKKVLGNESLATANSLSNLAALYHDMKDYAKAEPLCKEALQVMLKMNGPEHPATAISLNNLGTLYEATGEYAKAEPFFKEALRIWQNVLGSEHSLTAICLRNLATVEFDLNRLDEAAALAHQESAVELPILSRIFSFTSERQRLAYLDSFEPYGLLPSLKGSEKDFASAVLHYKGVVLDSIVEDRLLAKASQGSADRKLVEQLNQDKRQLGQLLLQPPQKLTAETSHRIDALQGEFEEIEGRLAQHLTGVGQVRYALGVRLEQVQSTIPNDGALVEYLRYQRYLGRGKTEQHYGAIVIFPEGVPLWVPLGTATEIEELVRKYGSLVRDSREEEELSANLQTLYQALWAPIGEAMPSQTKRIIISPDGQLNFISFATLLTKDHQFLAQRYSLQYAASGRDLLREVKPSIAQEVVLFANPDFRLAPTATIAKADNGLSDPGPESIGRGERGDIEAWSFGRLEGTQKERDDLVKKFAGWGWKSTDFTEKEATKKALLEIHSPSILHLATHGFFAEEEPPQLEAEPAAFLNDLGSVSKSGFFKNPMHRSGLALAGAQTTIEAWKRKEGPPVENDGILTAEDVSTLDLQGTWLVTLSACDTGSGEARAGEGVMGLRRGFIQAGAQNLLMTLWPISDEVTVQIMNDFYEAAHNGGNAPEALAQVQRYWLVKLRTEQGLSPAVNLAGPFIMSSQGRP